MIFLRKNYFRNGLKLCAHAHMRMVSPHILFFHLHTFFRREVSAVLSVFCCSAAFCGLFRCGLCCVLFGVFFGFLCAVFWFRVCMVVCLVIPVCFAGFSDVGENKGVSAWICTKRGRFGCDVWCFCLFRACATYVFGLHSFPNVSGAGQIPNPRKKKALLLNRITMCFQSSKPMRKNRR